jgi:hypothetical protein
MNDRRGRALTLLSHDEDQNLCHPLDGLSAAPRSRRRSRSRMVATSTRRARDHQNPPLQIVFTLKNIP